MSKAQFKANRMTNALENRRFLLKINKTALMSRDKINNNKR